ncbi:MAG: radical SAM protein [Parcubacteria group bacterium]
MKVLLINPPTDNTIASVMPIELEEGLDLLPPLGLMCLAAYLEKETSHEITILDCPAEGIGHERLKGEIQKISPDVIGLTAMTFTLIDVVKVAKNAKQANPDVKIILGGPHVIIYPNETMNIPEIDFLVLGEGERTLKLLLDGIHDPRKLIGIKGIVFRDNNKIINTGPADFVENIDSLPFPARHLVLYKKYFSVVSQKKPVTTMFTSRGCPYKCLFCNRPQYGKTFRMRSAKNVVKEMRLCQNMGIQEILIYDDTFGADRNRILDICSEIKKVGLNIAWDIRTRVDTVDADILRALKNAGCERIHYGVEAGTQKILNILRKGITLEQVENAFALTKKAGIQTIAYFMIGSPLETKADVLETVKLMKKLDPDYVHISVVTPFPATDLYRLALEEGIIGDDVWQKFAEQPAPNFIPPIWEKELNRAELFDLLKFAYRSFYLRPSYIYKKVLRVKSLSELIRKGRGALRLLKI